MRGVSVVVIAVLTAAVACSSPPPPPPPPPPLDDDQRNALNTWVAGFCDVDNVLTKMLFQERATLGPSPTEADRRKLLDNLKNSNEYIAIIRDRSPYMLGSSPTTAAEELLTRYRQQLDKSVADTAVMAKTAAQLPLAELTSQH
ncbi:MAG: hypothetical protein ACRDXB_02590, partial [Actinomycetes bacterium]